MFHHLFVHLRASDLNFDLVPETSRYDGVHSFLHDLKSHRKQSTQVHHIRLHFPDLLDNPDRRDIGPQVIGLKAIYLEHKYDDIFPDIMDIPGVRTNNNFPHIILTGGRRSTAGSYDFGCLLQYFTGIHKNTAESIPGRQTSDLLSPLPE